MKKLQLLAVLLLVCAGTVFATTAARVKTWASNATLTANDLNAEFDNVINFLNGSITLVNIDSTIRYRMDTLDLNYGLRVGTSPSATLGNILWGNGSLFISVTRDSAGVITKTGNQTITGKKTFSDTTFQTGPMMMSGEGTITNHVWFYILPKAADSLLVPSNRSQFVTKFWIDSLRTQFESEMYDSAAAVVTTNNGLIRPTFADSAARVVSDTADILRIYVQNTIEDSLVRVSLLASTAARDSSRKTASDTASALRTWILDRVEDSLSTIHTALDSINTNITAVSRYDTTLANKTGDGQYVWGIAGDTTWPGSFYKVSTKNKWFRADTSVAVRAYGVAMDSVLKGAACRFLISGTFRKDDWPKFPPGTTVFSDSVTAGKPNVGGQAAPKKMQNYGVAIDSSIILIKIDASLGY